MKNQWFYLIALSVLFFSACSSHVQTTSGQAYLEKYRQPQVLYAEQEEFDQDQKPQAEVSDDQTKKPKNFDQLIREVAAREPTLRFPARIGLARIKYGNLVNVPAQELLNWETSRKKLGPSFGEFVPVSSLISEMVAEDARLVSDRGDSRQVSGLINKIRLGAARQHLDAVLIYEVFSRDDTQSNLLTLADLSIIGAYILPSRNITTEGFANALLIDVIQGYPYGTAQANLDKSELSSTFGRDEKEQQLSDQVEAEVVVKLGAEVETMFRELRLALLQRQANAISSKDRLKDSVGE